jgi:ABC-type transporter Mla subunit MlaD
LSVKLAICLFKELQQIVHAHKPIIEKFEKTAAALIALCGHDDISRIRDSADLLSGRYDAIRDSIRARGMALDASIQESSQFSDKLDLILANLEGAAGQVRNPEPIAAHPDRIRDQIADNANLIDELEQRTAALQDVKDSAADIVAKAREDDPAVGGL